MTVRVLLFGAESAALGCAHVDLDAGDSPTCAQLKDRLAHAFPALRPHLGAGRIAVNSEFASPDHRIRPGDEVALIGLVSGG